MHLNQQGVQSIGGAIGHAFFKDLILPDVLALQGLYLIRMFQLMMADHFAGKINRDETGLGSGLGPLLELLHPRWDDARDLLVKLSREEPEAGVANFEATRPFIETSLAKNQDLLPMPKCLYHC